MGGEPTIIDSHVHVIDPKRPQGTPCPNSHQESRLYSAVPPLLYKAFAAPIGETGLVVVEASLWGQDNQWILVNVPPSRLERLQNA